MCRPLLSSQSALGAWELHGEREAETQVRMGETDGEGEDDKGRQDRSGGREEVMRALLDISIDFTGSEPGENIMEGEGRRR